MKAWMLCLLAVATLHLDQAIDQALTESETTNKKMVASLKDKEVISAYNNEWMKLRQKKRYMVADTELKLKKQREP